MWVTGHWGRKVAALMVVGAVGLGGCGRGDGAGLGNSGLGNSGLGNSGLGNSATGSVPAADQAPAELSDQAYQQRLADTDTALSAAWQRVGSAGPYGAAGDALSQAGAAVGRAADELSGLRLPERTGPLNDALLTGLRQTATDLATLSGRVGANELCANPSVVSGLSTATGVGQLRATAARLRAAGFRWGEFLGAPVVAPYRRLANNRILLDHRGQGMGTLTVRNLGDTDAVLKLVRGGKSVASMYVGSNNTATLGRIPNGAYEVYFTLGDDWDQAGGRFTRSCELDHFDDTLSYSTRSVRGGIMYRTYTISLQPVPDGTVTISAVTPAAFPH